MQPGSATEETLDAQRCAGQRAASGSNFELLQLDPPLTLLRSQYEQLSQMADFLQMEPVQIVRMALVDMARRPAFDDLFARRARDVR